MQASRVRLIIAGVATVLVLGVIIALSLYAQSLKVYKELLQYSSRYSTVVTGINNGTGIYLDREYYAVDMTDFTTPSNGLMLINPVKKTEDEQVEPVVQSAVYNIANDTKNQVYFRLSNSKRMNQRGGTLPQAAFLGLAFDKASAYSPTWQGATIYTIANKDELVDSALLLGSAKNGTTTWADSISIYLIDGALTEHAAAILPGVNIQNTVGNNGQASAALYSNRALAIGSIPSKQQDAPAAQALQEQSGQDSTADFSGLAVNVNMSITGTDILLVSPDDSPKSSTITPPLFDPDKPPAPRTRMATDTGSGNRISITGGVIAVGKNSTLTVGQDASGLGTVDLQPRSVLVDGGTLVLQNSEKNTIRITSDVHVRNGGRLIIGDGALINGNIYAYSGGTVEVSGSFEIQGQPITLGSEQIPGGIYIFNDNTFDADGDILGGGYFYAKRLYMIDGSDGIMPFIGHNVIHFLSKNGPAGYPLMYSEYACLESLQSNGICPHFGLANGITAPDIYLDFSEDTAVMRDFRSSGE